MFEEIVLPEILSGRTIYLCNCNGGGYCVSRNFKATPPLATSGTNAVFVSLQIYLAPFIVCLDHKMKSVVVCVRGTLSLKVGLVATRANTRAKARASG